MPTSVDKPISLTPLQTIKLFQVENPEYLNKTIGYAGRLDPMAEGLLLLLIGEENKKRKEYERLEKEYEFEVLLGLATDSYDCMGIIKNVNNNLNIRNSKLEISDILNSFVGISDQPYPPYSSARVKGKPLFYWARKGKIDEIKIPSKNITIYSIKLNTISKVRLSQICPRIISRIQKVVGEFRQEEIIKQWKKLLVEYPNLELIKLHCTISCSSGTYVRSIAHKLGQVLKVGGIAFSIKRTKIGSFSIKDAVNI